MTTLYGDLETFSERPLKHGTCAYAEAAEILLFTFAVDDGPVAAWDLTAGEPMPFDLEQMLRDPEVEIVFQNSFFDRTVFRLATNTLPLLQRVGSDIPRWRDTMVQALAHSLPGGLEKLGDVLRVDQDKRKLEVGKQLVRLFCIPPAKNLKRGRATRETHPVEWQQFVEYAKNDIEAMRVIHKKCPRWNYQGEELALWHLDQKINDRGVCVDLELATAAIETVKKEQARLKSITQGMTGYDAEAGTGVESATKRDKLLMYLLEEYGVVLPDLKKDTLERRIDDPDLPIELRNLLAIRLMASTSSTSKYQAVARGASSDGRLRGLLQFNGASRTGRWAGRLFQPQNLMRPDMEQEEIDLGVEAIKAGSADLVFENVMRVCANAMRGIIVAPPGKKLVVGDLANIEGRMAAWLTGENWKLKAFAEYDTLKRDDAGNLIPTGKKKDPWVRCGPDLYKLAYAKAFNIDHEDVEGDQRQIGKVMELMLQYEGGVGAFITGAATYGIDLDEMAEAALPAVPADVRFESEGFYDWTVKQKRSTFGLPRETFIACDALKRLWRYAHPSISSYWGELKDAVISAINRPGQSFNCRRLVIRRDGPWLKIRLPSGRFLCYPSPQVDDKGVISYMGVNQYSRQWGRIKTYGGKIFENCIAENTPVLTHRGWVPIQEVRATDRVWDGVEWVSQGGCVYKGKQFVIEVYRTIMTADHLVLTTEGWRRASSCEGYNRAPCRLPDGYEIPRQRRYKIAVGGGLPMRQGRYPARHRASEAAEARHQVVLRMHAQGIGIRERHETRHVEPPRLLGVAVDARPMPLANTPCLGQLRRAWHQGVRKVGGFLGLLGGYGADVSAWLHARTTRQLEGLFPLKLRVAHSAGASQQHTAHGFPGHTSRPDAAHRGGAVLRGAAQHTGIPAGPRLDDREGAHDEAGLHQSRVYDLLNCGPRNRFVVRDSDGAPLVVHNCTQAAARDVLANGMVLSENNGYEVVLSVHDELITEAPDTEEYSTEGLCALMATVPEWAEGIPLSSAGFSGYRYKKD